MKKIGILILILFVFSIANCGKGYKSSVIKSLSELNMIRCVVVLPFDSVPTKDNEKPGRIIATMIANKLLSTKKFNVLEWDEVDAILQAQNITLPASIDSAFAARVGEILSVEGVLFGAVTEYGYKKGRNSYDAVPVVGVISKLLSVKSKDVIWSSSFARSSKDFFDTERDPLTRVSMIVVNDLVNSFAGKVKKRNVDYTAPCWNPFISGDMDADGILNFADNCPIEPESFEGILDTDGCPEPEIVAGDFRRLIEIKGDRIVYKGEITYVRKEATLLPSAVPILKGLATVLKENPQIQRVTIEGFSECLGNEKFIEEFSFNRAMAVKNFLMQEGVSPERLTAVGYDKERNWQRSLVKEIEFSLSR